MNTNRAGLCLGVFAIATVSLVLALATGRYVLHRYTCSGDASVISSPGALYDVEVNGEACNSTGTVNFVQVKLKGAGPMGSDATVFVYEPIDDGRDDDDSNEPPMIRWTARDHLEVMVDSVSRIDKQQFSSHGVTISYQLAHVNVASHTASWDRLRKTSQRLATL
jgi:hypothetical protein